MTDIMALLTLREVQEACPRTRPRSIYTKLAEVAAAALRVDFSLFSHRFPTWKMHSTPGCTWKMQLMQKTPKTGHLRGSLPAKATGQLKSFDLGFCQQVPAYFYSYRIFYVLFFLSGCIHFNHDLL